MVRRGRSQPRAALAASEDIDYGDGMSSAAGASGGGKTLLGRVFRSKSLSRSKSRGRAVRLTDDDEDTDIERRIAMSKSQSLNGSGNAVNGRGSDTVALATTRGASAAASRGGKNKGSSSSKKGSRWPSIGRSRSRTKGINGQNGTAGGSNDAVEQMARQAAALAEAQAAIRPVGQQYDDAAWGRSDKDGGAMPSVGQTRPAAEEAAAMPAAATMPSEAPRPPSPEETYGIQKSIVRTLSRDEVKNRGNLLAQMQEQAQNESRRSRSLSRDRSIEGASSQNSVDTEEDEIDVGDAIGMTGTSSAPSRLSAAARRAAEAASSLTKGGHARKGSSSSRGVRFPHPTLGEDGIGGDTDDAFLAASSPNRTQAEVREISAIRAVLNRPPGKRDTLPPMARRYVINVAPAAYDDTDRTFKYAVTVVRAGDEAALEKLGTEMFGQGTGGNGKDDAGRSLLPPAKTFRSLPDFLFLDTYLRTEFAGASLPPLLSVALYGREILGVKSSEDDGEGSVTTTSTFGTMQPAEPVRTVSDLAKRCQQRLDEDMDRNAPVDEEKLANWLGDVLNGVRGNGEWLLLPNAHAAAASSGIVQVDVASSEALETFLYRNTDSLPAPPRGGMDDFAGDGSRSGGTRTSCLAIALDPPDSPAGSGGRKKYTALEALLARPLACLDQRCGGQWDDMHNMMNDSKGRRGMPSSGPTPNRSGGVISFEGAIGGLPENASPMRVVQRMTFKSPLLTAQRDAIATYRRHATKTMHRLKILRGDELRMSTAWKRFAISLSNLFAFEKDLQVARVGGVSKEKLKEEKKKQPYHKTTKNMIDDGLRVLAKRKVERSTPGLDVVAEMMSNCLADLSAVDPCMVEYGRAVHLLEDPVSRLLDEAGCATVDGDTVWKQGSVKAVAALKNAASSIAGKMDASAPPAPPQSDDSPASLSSQQKAERLRLLHHGQSLEGALTSLFNSTSIRSARTASRYLRTEAGRAANLRAGGMTLRAKLHIMPEMEAAIAERDARHSREEKEDDVAELSIVRQMFELVQEIAGANGEEDTVVEEERQAHEESCSRALLLASDRVGRWNGELALSLMECSGVEDAEVRVEETTRDLRLVRKYAIGLRENVERCADAVGMLNGVILGADATPHRGDDQSLDTSLQSTYSNISSSASYEAMKINRKRELFLASMARSLSGTVVPSDADELQRRKALKSAQVLERAGVDLSDVPGWLAASEIIETGQQHQHRVGRCGELLVDYQRVRDAEVAVFLARINQLLADYHKRVEMIESFVYMHCVGIQLEKHYSQLRSEALADWEQKTDITTAINIATKKNLPALVDELRVKLESLSPSISHTSMKKAKEKHLASKLVKEDLQKLAERRFQRTRETSTERAIAMIKMWSQHEEKVTHDELRVLGELINEMEKHITRDIIEKDGGAHLLAVATATSRSNLR